MSGAAPLPAPAIIPPGQEKFTVPVLATVSALGAWLSALSLLAFAVVSVLAIAGSEGHPWWAVLPFWFTAVGSAVGFVYETWLVLRGTPFQLTATPLGGFVQTLRAGNLAPVFGSTYLAYALLTYGTTDQAGWLILVVGAVAGYLLVLFLFRAPLQAGFFVLTIGLAAQLVLLWTGPDVQRGSLGLWLLTAAAVALYSTTIIGSWTPIRSTVFHVVGTAVVALLYFGFGTEFARAGASAHQVTTEVWLWLLAVVPAAVWFAFRLYPNTWAVLRSVIANFVWPLFYLVIAGGMRIARPRKLSDLYKGRENQLKPLTLHPYYLAHPRNLTHKVSVPALDDALSAKILALGPLVNLVKFIFWLASQVNRFFPFANTAVPLALKPRMEPSSDGSDYWPKWLLRKVWIPKYGWFQIESGVRGPGDQPAPKAAVEAYLKGQLLAYLVEYGIAGPFVEPVTRDGRAAFKLDLSFLEKYETKPDYEPYGGAAYFEIDHEKRCLRVTHVRAPRSQAEVPVDTNSATFRHAEDLVLASIYFYVVSGKHLLEIHMGLNLVEVALFNAFDANQQWFHPVRLALYPHLFAHELAEELTTENLLEDRAIFPQIFATTNSALMLHLNDRFHDYQLARDEDFEHREGVLLTGTNGKRLEDVLPRCSLIWEKQYAAIWAEYATAMVGAAYTDDAAVSADVYVRAFYEHMSATFLQPLPARYDEFRTRRGLARFVSDTMHHLIIRHEVYGTTGVRLALDPRINKVQVPKDGGPSAIDEWRALACVAMATSRVRYTLLLTNFSDVFDDLKDPGVRAKYVEAFNRMQDQLKALGKKYVEDKIDNYDTLRPLPEELDIGAGY